MKRLAGLGLLTLAAGLAASGCASTGADWRERYLEKERDASDLASQLSEERNAHSTAVAQLEEARARITDLEGENASLRSRPAEAAAPAPAGDEMGDTLARLKQQGMDAYQTADGNIAIVIPSDINFAAGSKDLTGPGKAAVGQVAKELDGQFAGYTVRIEGHTDGDPIRKSKFTDNFELGAERALTVLRSLVKDHGLAPERLIAATRGETVPVADNKSEKGKARNRRVEVVVMVPKDAALAK
ncbi:MAG: OmpA family protein [Planctomycetaceae bacterium]|nr:OmpA family protein [Planctomycetota bacterium]NUN51450.1 OmpA family protein [Planctomycetaceae bacterium]